MSIEQISHEAAIAEHQPVLELPLDHRRDPRPSLHHSSRFAFSLPPYLAKKIVSVAEGEGVSLPAVYLAAYSLMLSRYAGSPEVAIHLGLLSRRDQNGSEVSDDFRGDAVIRLDCAPDATVRHALLQAAKTLVLAEGNVFNDGAPGRFPVIGRAGFLWEGKQRLTRTRFQHKAIWEESDLSLRIRSSRADIEPELLYRSDLFESHTIERMSFHLTRLLEQIANGSDLALKQLDMMSEQERALVLRLSADCSSDYPQACLHELFAQQVALNPDAEAVVYGSDRLTYLQLDRRSNQVAQYLISQGICPEDRIGIFMDRSVDLIVAILGTLKAGATYLPIDVDYPLEQLRFIAEDSALRLVLTQRRVKGSFPATAPAVFIDAMDSPLHKCSYAPVENRSNPESIAVVNYTSGSTGQPKAARIPHRAAVRMVRNTNYIQIVPTDRIAQSGSPAFDAGIMEIWLALANGATLVGLEREILLSPGQLSGVLRADGINILILNTSYVHQIARDAPEALKGVRKILFGGEAAEPEPLRKLLERVGPDVLVNTYGPAEGCVITSYHEIIDIPENAITVPIGKPVSNTQVYLLDELQRPVPIGVQGEIYIGGEGVACGYLNRPELTAQRFIPDIFSKKPDRLLYRTGDFARMHSNGDIEFVRRTDEQVKVRGHRIELAEVRHALASHPDVKQLFVMVREDVIGDKRLVAYVTLHRAVPQAQEELRRHAVAKLPLHMVPSAFVILEAIPLNTNGKIDRKSLPAPGDRTQRADSYQSPESDLEAKLTQVWEELLRVDHIGVNDDFFELGGHSLLAARLIARIEKQTGNNIPMATLFEAPTIAQLAERLRQRDYESAWSPLVELHAPQEVATAQPFFCVHSLGANLVSFHNVAALMRGGRAIYGLQPHGLDGQQAPFESIEAMASAYLKEIRKKQPHGPYYLGGICLGGVIAYEISQQLQAAGEEVALTALIDSYAPGELRYLHDRHPLALYLDRHLGEMLLLPSVERLKYLIRWAANGGVLLGRALGFGDRSSLAKATRKVAEAHRRAIFSYRPKPYPGKIVQLMCSDAAHRVYEDRRLAWSALASEGFEVRVIPGDHLSMVEAPFSQTLAQELQSCLDRATASHAPVEARPSCSRNLSQSGCSSDRVENAA